MIEKGMMELIESLRNAEIVSRYQKRELNTWKDIAIHLAYAGYCEYCQSRGASELEGCPDLQKWHTAYNAAMDRTDKLS